MDPHRQGSKAGGAREVSGDISCSSSPLSIPLPGPIPHHVSAITMSWRWTSALKPPQKPAEMTHRGRWPRTKASVAPLAARLRCQKPPARRPPMPLAMPHGEAFGPGADNAIEQVFQARGLLPEREDDPGVALGGESRQGCADCSMAAATRCCAAPATVCRSQFWRNQR